MRLVIGIDPGVTGALARISDYGDRLSYDWVEDMPVLEATRGRRKVDAARTAALIRAAQHPLSRVFTKVEIWIEDTHAMPKERLDRQREPRQKQGRRRGDRRDARDPALPREPAEVEEIFQPQIRQGRGAGEGKRADAAVGGDVAAQETPQPRRGGADRALRREAGGR